MALKNDGSVVSWGRDLYGQTEVPEDLTDAVYIVAGTGHSAAIKENGEIVSWGSNEYGQGDPMPGLSPAILRGTNLEGAQLSSSDLTAVDFSNSSIVDLSIGDFHTLALKDDGTVIAWGEI